MTSAYLDRPCRSLAAALSDLRRHLALCGTPDAALAARIVFLEREIHLRLRGNPAASAGGGADNPSCRSGRSAAGIIAAPDGGNDDESPDDHDHRPHLRRQ